MIAGFLDKLASKSAFPKIRSVELELKKIDFIRIILGLIVFVRYYEIVYSIYIYSNNIPPVFIFLLVFLTLFIIGFAVPLTSIILLFLAKSADVNASVNNLGTTFLIQFLLLSILANSGKNFSLDGLLLRKTKRLSKVIQKLYNILGNHNAKSLTTIYFFSFLVYAIISLGALLYHLTDDYWLRLMTIKALLINSYLSTYYIFFRQMDDMLPIMFSMFSIFGGLLQTIFQLFMAGLIFHKNGKNFIIFWGIIFFLVSLFLINISYLPYVEIAIWTIIFFPVKSQESQLKNSITKQTSIRGKTQTKIYNAFYNTYAIAILVLILFRFPYISFLTSKVIKNTDIHHGVNVILDRIGLDLPNVFNKTDLTMGDHWMVIYKFYNGKWTLVPIISEDGSRLNYHGFDVLNFSNHNTDFLYFGGTLIYRRAIILDNNYLHFHTKGQGYASIYKRIKYDYNHEKHSGKVEYKVKVYKSKSSKPHHWISSTGKYEKSIVFQKKYFYNGEKLIVNENRIQ